MHQRKVHRVLALAYGAIAVTAYNSDQLEAHLQTCAIRELQCDIPLGTMWVDPEGATCEHGKLHFPFECWVPDKGVEGAVLHQSGTCDEQYECTGG